MRLLPLALLAALPALAAPTPEDLEFFESNVRPMLVAKCQMCHSAQMASSDLDLSSAAGFVKGGARGAVVAPGDPAASLLLKVVSFNESLKMPPMGKLSDEEIAHLTEWVERGAPWPGAEQLEAVETHDEKTGFTDEQKTFWAFQPVVEVEPPAVENEEWVSKPIDRFILAKLEAAGLEPAPEADKATLLRRVSFDLTGLPPTEEEVEAFLADESPDAYKRVVERLLASPRYGERWGRHWLDVARYADSTGNDEDHRYPYAWRYRDYVIEAFNEDMPFDRFVREQIAGDLMPGPDGSALYPQGVIATGFLALGPKAIAQQDKTKMLYDVYDEQVDVVSRAFLGLTMACARCHDHKFDPILTRDYYSMVGFFANTRSFKDPSTHVSKLLFTPLVDEEQWALYEAEQEKIRRVEFELDNLAEIEIEAHVEGLKDQVAQYMLAARKVYEDGVSDTAGVASEAGLDAKVLEGWVEYLRPEPGVVRAHLTDWEKASPAERAAAAEAFEASFETTFDEFADKLRKWRKQANRPAEEITMGIPSKPGFTPGENRFFHEVYIAKDGPLAFKSDEAKASVLKPETKQRIAGLEKTVAELKADAMQEPDRACAVQEKSAEEAVEQRVFVRGDYNSPGDPAPKVFPAIIEGFDQTPADGISGRRALADWIAKPENPLTARVMVNRVWGWHFGEGLVRTPSNFGKMGERPTHPELLDWLATRFVESGWSVKSLHREIVFSSAYRMSSGVSDKVAMEDPENKLLSRFNRRRLDVEELRDGLLAVDGDIQYVMGGSLQEGFGTDGENSSSRMSINPDEHVRRTVYLPLRRANLPALLNLFDFGDATTTTGKRVSTNVAPQALFLMNSKFVAERARGLAEQLMSERPDENERVRSLYLRTLNRPPSPDEVDRGRTYVAQVQENFGDFEPLDAWESYARILMASNEFIYVD